MTSFPTLTTTAIMSLTTTDIAALSTTVPNGGTASNMNISGNYTISSLQSTQMPAINMNSIGSFNFTPYQVKPVIHPAKGNIMVSDGQGGYTSVDPLDFFLTWLKKESKTEQAKVAMAEVLEKFSDLLVTLKISRSDPGMEEDD